MDMRLGDIGLQRESEHGDEHDDAPRRVQAPPSGQFRCTAGQETVIAMVSPAYVPSGTIPQLPPGGRTKAQYDSVNVMAGFVPLCPLHVPRFRLFVSYVKIVLVSQLGAVVAPSVN
jgi:hypothetical protein